ncbi:MAG: SIMPL domain-containing protein [Lachnospiraceae bacterium]|nr:SIMPL domain-containing protein [Lachnospiraceae bacterium]
MEDNLTSVKKKFEFAGPLIIGLAIVISCGILAGAFLKYKTDSTRTISATGSASVDFEADLIVWRGYFSAYSTSSAKAYDLIKKQASQVEDYLYNKGLSEDEYVFSAVDISESTLNNYDEYGNFLNSTVQGYNLSQSVVISSSNIDLVEDISRDISKLLDSGVELTSGTPEYYCTALDEIKLDLIEKATENAKTRVSIIADQSGAKLGKLRSSNLGVFQITARNSGTSYYSYDGYLDTTSRQKTATITVKLEYDIR